MRYDFDCTIDIDPKKALIGGALLVGGTAAAVSVVKKKKTDKESKKKKTVEDIVSDGVVGDIALTAVEFARDICDAEEISGSEIDDSFNDLEKDVIDILIDRDVIDLK